MTIREAISRVQNSINAVNRDQRKSKQYIFNMLISYAQLLIKQDSKNKKIFQLLSSLTPIDCVELEDVDIYECSPFLVNKCSSLKRTINKIPKAYSSTYSTPLVYISTLDDSNSFNLTTPFDYSKITQLEIKPKGTFFWVENGYIYIPDTDIDLIKVRGFFQADVVTNQNDCHHFLDQEFIIPSYLVSDLFKLTLQELFSFNVRIPTDENPNLNSNEK